MCSKCGDVAWCIACHPLTPSEQQYFVNDARNMRRLYELKNSQLAECTRVMREVAEAITSNASRVDAHVPPTFGLGDALRFQAKRLFDARAGKAAS